MDDVGLVQTILDFTSLDLLDSSSNVGGNGAGLGGGHQTLGAQDLTKTANNAHHVGRSDNDVEVEPVFLGDLLDQLHAADIVSASSLCLFNLCVLSENQNAAGLAGAVGQNNCATDLLVCVTGVNAQLDMQLDGLVELSRSTLHDQIQGFGGVILNSAIDQLRAFLILFASKQCYYPPIKW